MFEKEERDERFSEVWECLNGDYPSQEDLERAQGILDKVKDRDAEWHYVQAAVEYYKRFYLDCRKELKKAIKLDPENGKYRAALEELTAMANEAQKAGTPLPEGKWDGFAETCLEGCCTSCC